ncbi:hypothetical protein [Aliamphritea spongicola]|nr:hypothetical protein [Aliamphritea spongicola]
MKLTFDAGSLLLSGDTSLLTEHSVDHLVFDSRVDAWRALHGPTAVSSNS